jgi:hypothetical protein
MESSFLSVRDKIFSGILNCCVSLRLKIVSFIVEKVFLRTNFIYFAKFYNSVRYRVIFNNRMLYEFRYHFNMRKINSILLSGK